MTLKEAQGVAELLNSRNQLGIAYTAARVLQHADEYIFDAWDGVVVACVQLKNVQWYQCEICHLSVHEKHEGKGLGKKLIRRAEEKAHGHGARIVQCTIRVGNERSEAAFRRSGYREACCFYNAATDNYVAIWQKALCNNP
jgi:N-acetylglutamate synthase-like GNAT family acetyltransferase